MQFCQFPSALRIGLVSASLAICLWTLEQLTGQMIFELLTYPVKAALLFAPAFFISDLSAILHGKRRLALKYFTAISILTLAALFAYLPFRQSFVTHFGNDVYRWYFEGMQNQRGDYAAWKIAWDKKQPHLIEPSLILIFYAWITLCCAMRRWNRLTGTIILLVGYAFLSIAPNFLNLIEWDYDTFLKGIALDSISMDLHPLVFWFPGDHSIFLYCFLFIFFAMSAACFQKEALSGTN